MYEALFAKLPDHPQLTAAPDEGRRRAEVEAELGFLRRTARATVFLEVGAWDCALAREVAKRARVVYAVDVSESITTAAAGSGEMRS